MTSASSKRMIDFRKARSFCAAGASSRGAGASTLSGGMRTACPASRRAFGCVRLPFTRTSPLRMMRWIWLKDRPGNRASKKRSTRTPLRAPDVGQHVVLAPRGDGTTAGAPDAVDAAARLADGRRRAGAGRIFRASCPAPLLPQLRPVFEPLPDFTLEAALRRVIKFLPLER